MLTQRAPILWPDAIPDSPVPPYMNMYSEIDHLTQSCAWKIFETVHSGNELDGWYVRGHDSDGTVPLTCIQYCHSYPSELTSIIPHQRPLATGLTARLRHNPNNGQTCHRLSFPRSGHSCP